jgi:tetratricopeptide (TPR) repeat protein
MTASDTTDLTRAGLMIELGRFADATRLLTTVLAGAPDSCRGWCLLSRAHLGNGRPAEALDAARRASALDPANDWPFRLISTALISLGCGADAVPAAAEARRLAPHSWRSHVCLAQAAAAADQLELAAEAAQAGLAIAPDQADVHVTAGRVALSRGDVAEAALRQEAALAIEPTHGGAINELGRISLQLRDPAAAAEHFLRAARTSPGNGVFGRNSELALRYLAVRLARPILLAATLCAAMGTLLASGHRAAAAALAPAVVVLLFWVAARIRAIPRHSRRHLPRLVRARLSGPWSAANTKTSAAGTSSAPPAAAGPVGSKGPSSRL